MKASQPDFPWDFNGQFDSKTFTANPKLDPLTGEAIAFSCDSGGQGSDRERVQRGEPVFHRDGTRKR